jgi:hypothetical protein
MAIGRLNPRGPMRPGFPPSTPSRPKRAGPVGVTRQAVERTAREAPRPIRAPAPAGEGAAGG